MAKPKEKKKKKPAKEKVTTPWDKLDLEALENEVQSLESKHNEAFEKRLKVETEYNAVLSYYNIALEKGDALDTDIKLKHYDFQDLEYEQKGEDRMYSDKVVQLKFDFDQKKKKNEEIRKEQAANEKNDLQKRLQETEAKVRNIQLDLKEQGIVFIEKVRTIKELNEKEQKEREATLNQDLEAWSRKCSNYEQELESELHLQQYAEFRHLTEEVNRHIHELKEKHKNLYDSTQLQYVNTSETNCSKIEKLRQELEKVERTIEFISTKMKNLDAENKRLSGPLLELTSTVSAIQTKIKSKSKNRQSINNIKARNIVVNDRIREQEIANASLQSNLDELMKEQKELQHELETLENESNIEKYANIALLKGEIKDTKAKLLACETALGIEDIERCAKLEVNGRSKNIEANSIPLESLLEVGQRAFNKASWRIMAEEKAFKQIKAA
ncbi:hypothetical protein CTEN210_00339 [Chaetoceros tenuissimus]|uniref:Growth arrest-specific protein 8 domain-containing protein n=1 Tax=Chaetoceros tenuissimus TaxID=426638 RepID=A0AAD3CFI6_9STRA|nr:hypothetical protein CTEN210_00339 [Chaetoceros tenuissimus]